VVKHTFYQRLRSFYRDENIRTVAKIYAVGLAAVGAALLYSELKIEIPEDET